MWTCSRCFSCYSRLSSFAAEGADAESACIKDTCAGNASFTIGACIKIAGSESNNTEGTGIESACTGVAGAVE